MKKIILSLASLLLVSSAFAGGYRISLQGQRQLAMGHTGVAVIGQNAESIFFNPANGVFLKDKWSFSGGVNYLTSTTRFQNTLYNWQAETTNVGTPFYVYGNYKFSDKLAFGIAVYSPYGSSVKWEDDWVGSHLVNNIKLQAIYVQPTLSYKITDDISVGAGLIYVNGGVTFNRNLSRNMTNEAGERSDITIEAQGVTAFGYNVGFTAKLDSFVTFGANYRSHIDMKAAGGTATFGNLPSFMQGTFTDGKFSATLPLPAELTLGFSYKITDQWLAAVDVNHTFWNKYKSLDIDFENPALPDSQNPRNYKNTNTYRVGIQYKPSDKFSVRAGGYFDESPVQNGYFAPETPRNNSIAGTLGFTYQVTPKLGIDVGANFVHFKEVDNSYDYYQEDGNPVSFGGTYRSAATSIGVGVSYNF